MNFQIQIKMFFQQKTEKISRIKKVKSFFKDRYHLLFKGAAENHLRIQKALQNPDGSYDLSIHFESYTDLKKYQKKLRRMTVSLSGATAMVIIAVIVAPYVMNPNRSSAATFIFKQTGWGASGTGTTAAYPAGNSGFVDYTANPTNITIVGAGADNAITMSAPTTASVGDANYTGTAATGFYVDASNNLVPLKPQGALCSAAGECANSSCLNGACCLDACCGVSSVSYWSDTYSTVAIGNQCWFAENLRTPKTPSGSTLTLNTAYYCYAGDANCASPSALADAGGSKYGALYTWAAMMNGSASVTTAPGPQGLCPTGWHIPTRSEQFTLLSYLQVAGNTCIDAAQNYSCAGVAAKLVTGGSSGFKLPFAGYYNGTTYSGKAAFAELASATENNTTTAYAKVIDSSSVYFYSSGYTKTWASSVRCLKN